MTVCVEVFLFTCLGELIQCVEKFYNYTCVQWERYYKYERFNFKKKTVNDIRDYDEILYEINNYRDFMNIMSSQAIEFIPDYFWNNNVTSRVKAQNSLEAKIDKYVNGKEEKGKIPINKCINDIFGIRIVVDGEFTPFDVGSYVKEKFPQYKCIDSSKYDYIASHIYFKKDNYSFQWELQVWREQDRQNNLESHAKYKQEYTSWEMEYGEKGGDGND